MKDKGISSLEHASWRCQYHIVFALKYRREVFYQLRLNRKIYLWWQQVYLVAAFQQHNADGGGCQGQGSRSSCFWHPAPQYYLGICSAK